MTTAQVVETLVTVNNTQPNEHTQPTYQVTPGFKPSQFYVHLDDRANNLQTTKTRTLKMTTVEVVNQPARKIFSRGLLRLG